MLRKLTDIPHDVRHLHVQSGNALHMACAICYWVVTGYSTQNATLDWLVCTNGGAPCNSEHMHVLYMCMSTRVCIPVTIKCRLGKFTVHSFKSPNGQVWSHPRGNTQRGTARPSAALHTSDDLRICGPCRKFAACPGTKV